MKLKHLLIDWLILDSDFRYPENFEYEDWAGESCVEGDDGCEVCNYCICWRAIFLYCTVTAVIAFALGYFYAT